MQINEVLRSLGLNEKEAGVYIGLLQLGRATAYAIAEKSGLKRPTVYVVLEALRRKGVVHKVPHFGKHLFVAKSPDVLVSEFAEKAELVRKALPQLTALSKAAGKPNVLYFEGLDGVRQALFYKLKNMSGKELTIFAAHAETASDELIAVFDEWNDRAKALGIKMRGVVPRHETVKKYRKTDREYGRNIKIIPPEEYNANISIDISDSFVRIVAFRDLQAIIIENKDIASSLKQIFELVWKCR